MPSNAYRFIEHWTIPGFSPLQVYEVLSDARLLPEWWKGVYLEAKPEGEWTTPRVGGRARVKARGFFPYRLQMTLEATALEPGKLVEVHTQGDLEGVWRATLVAEGAGTRVDIDEEVRAQKPLIRVLSPLLKPLFAWNHYWTTPRGEEGLRAYLAKRYQNSGNPCRRITRDSEPGSM